MIKQNEIEFECKECGTKVPFTASYCSKCSRDIRWERIKYTCLDKYMDLWLISV